MNKEEAVKYMIAEIEKIERQRIAENLSVEPNQKKSDVVAKIKKVLEGVKIDDEN